MFFIKSNPVRPCLRLMRPSSNSGNPFGLVTRMRVNINGEKQKSSSFIKLRTYLQFLCLGRTLNWEFTIARTNAKSAPGTCGWRYSELKLLPRPAIQHLAKLFQQVIETAGFTANFMTARTVLLAKVEQPQHIGHGRPITCLHL